MRHGYLLILLLASLSAHGQIYRWTDENGRVHFSDQEPVTQESEEVNPEIINSYTTVSYDTVVASLSSNRLVMYSAEWCGVCKRAKRFLAEAGISYVERDIDKSKSARIAYDKLDGKGVPIFIQGSRRMNGFKPDWFDQLM